jgi:hypothetical protein
MVRYYRQAYGDAAGLEKFIEDSFKYKYPSAYAKETGIGETTPGELSDAARAAAAAQSNSSSYCRYVQQFGSYKCLQCLTRSKFSYNYSASCKHCRIC